MCVKDAEQEMENNLDNDDDNNNNNKMQQAWPLHCDLLHTTQVENFDKDSSLTSSGHHDHGGAGISFANSFPVRIHFFLNFLCWVFFFHCTFLCLHVNCVLNHYRRLNCMITFVFVDEFVLLVSEYFVVVELLCCFLMLVFPYLMQTV